MVSLNKNSLAFILYDWATSPITTIHTTFIFSVYFVEKIAVKNGSFLWGVIIATAAIMTAFMGPILGSYADKKRKRKLILFFLTILGGFSTMLLWFAKPGIDYLVFASIFSCISIFTMEVVFVLYNSLLSTSTNKKNYGILSGLSWAAGYLAGIISLVLCLTFFILPEKLILDSAVRKLKIQVAHSGKLSNEQIISILIFILIFLGWVFFSPILGLGIISLIGVIIYLSFGLIEWKELNKNTNWGVIMLFGAAISVGVQMKETGAALWIANNFINYVNNFFTNPNFSYSVISVIITSSLTNILSNAATIAVLGPIVINIGGDSIILPMITALSSAFGFLTIVASPSYMIIHSSGLLKGSDFLKGGWKMMIMSIIILLIFSNLIWPIFF